MHTVTIPFLEEVREDLRPRLEEIQERIRILSDKVQELKEFGETLPDGVPIKSVFLRLVSLETVSANQLRTKSLEKWPQESDLDEIEQMLQKKRYSFKTFPPYADYPRND